MRPLAILVAALLLTGCSMALPADPTRMSAEQLAAWSKDKNAAVQCAVVSTPYKGMVVSMNLDKAVIVNGTMTIKDGCEISLSTTQNPPRP